MLDGYDRTMKGTYIGSIDRLRTAADTDSHCKTMAVRPSAAHGGVSHCHHHPRGAVSNHLVYRLRPAVAKVSGDHDHHRVRPWKLAGYWKAQEDIRVA